MSVNFDKTQELGAVPTLPAVAYSVPRVNLLPPEIGAKERFRVVQLGLGGAVLGVLVIAGACYGLAAHSVTQAQQQKDAQDAITTQLTKEEAKYAAVPAINTQIDTLKNAQAQAMSSDIAWPAQLDQMAAEFPANFVFKTLSITLNTAGTATPSTDPLATPGTIGTISVTGTGPTQLKTAEWMEVLKNHKGFVDPYYTSSALADENNTTVTNVTSTVSFTSDLLTHRFDRKAN